MNLIRKTKYWNVRVLATSEEKDFETKSQAEKWCNEVSRLFQQPMKFEIEEITYKTYAYEVTN